MLDDVGVKRERSQSVGVEHREADRWSRNKDSCLRTRFNFGSWKELLLLRKRRLYCCRL